MKWLSFSIRFLRIGKMEVRFHFSIVFSLFITYFIFHPADLQGAVLALLWLAGFILCVLLHELGHALAARLAGIEVKSIVIWLLGGLTNLERKSEKPFHNLAISAAGPLANMALAFLFVAGYILLFFFAPREIEPPLFLWVQKLSELCLSLALLNVILVVFNLLPIYPLDGGNIMHAALDGLFGRSNADLITMIVSIPVLLCLIAFGLATRDYLLLASCVLIGLAIGTLNRTALRKINLGLNYLFKRSGYYYLQGDYERAAQLFTLEIDREPEQPNHYLARAACHLNMTQKERALADIERALKLNPKSFVALQLRGELYSMDKDYEAALDYFSRAQALNPHWAVPHFDRSSIMMDKGEYEPALAELNKAVSMTSQFPLFFMVRSLLHFKLGNLASSHNDQDSALRLSEKDALTVSALNLTLYEGYLDWAEDYYARAIAKLPRSAFAYQGRADAYRMNNEHENAIADYTRGIEINPREPLLYLGRGKSYQALGQLEQAAADFRQVGLVTDKLHLKRQAEELFNKVTVTSEVTAT